MLKVARKFAESKKNTHICNVIKNKKVNMTQEELKELESLLWKYKLKYAKELNKKRINISNRSISIINH